MNTKIKQIVIWGHKLHSHTHSYVHGAFAKAFESMGYNVLWLDNNDKVDSINFSNSLFITEGQVDQKIPINKESVYVLHNCDEQRYLGTKFVNLQVFTNGIENSEGFSGQKLDNMVYYDSNKNKLYQPWATDLLASEITENYEEPNNKIAIWIGSIWGGYHGNDTELSGFIESCKKNGYTFKYGQPGSCSFEQNMIAVKQAEIAPAIVGRWQKVNGYLPCRIFKNISYGKLGLTNSKTVSDLFEENVVFDTTDGLLERYLSMTTQQRKAMFLRSCKLVKEKHTYSNRINTILSVLGEI